WARTVACPNPACSAIIPLVKSWWLGKKKGREAYLIPHVSATAKSSRQVIEFEIGHDLASAPAPETDGTVISTGARCVACGSVAPLNYVREEGKAGRISNQLLATVAAGDRKRIYVAPTGVQESAANVERPTEVPTGSLGYDPRAITAPNYGFTELSDL